jgi:hypothetical protein
VVSLSAFAEGKLVQHNPTLYVNQAKSPSSNAPPWALHTKSELRKPILKTAHACAHWRAWLLDGSAQRKAGETTFDFNPPNGNPGSNGFILFGSNAGNAWHTNGGFTGLER